jgi:hypothetical protein
MRTFLITMLAAGAVGIASTSKLVAAPANGTGIIAAAQTTSLRQDVVDRQDEVWCKINGDWQPGRCPGSDSRVTCVDRRTEQFRHSGHCSDSD